jgi:signal transduction histidine kinase
MRAAVPSPSPDPTPSSPDARGLADAEAMLALAHGLRTPLTALALGMGILDDGVLGALNEGQREIVHTLVGEIARLTVLVERHLDTGRLGAYTGPVERVRIDLSDLVRRAAAPIERQAKGRGVHMAFTLPDAVAVVADPVKLGWVAVSLMGNALRYSPDGATIDVALAVSAAAGAELAVRDRGPGLGPEVEARIFDRDGGPGLFLAREIVEAHGGRIAASTTPGGGSTFTISLPAAPGSSHPVEAGT